MTRNKDARRREQGLKEKETYKIRRGQEEKWDRKRRTLRGLAVAGYQGRTRTSGGRVIEEEED